MSLRLSKDLTLPLEAVTQTFLIVGKRGSGKTSTAVRLAEQFAHAGVPFVVLDPADVWWGLKSSKDGKQPGLSVYVFGGRHSDLPLEPTAGALMADVVMEHRFPVVLSIKHFSGNERTRFVTDFASRLYRQNTEPLHLFLEEAHEVAPQHTYRGEEPMLGAMQRIWKLGRSSGLGGSAITQRPASLNKNITTQAEVLIVHRTIGPQDVAAIREWIRYHGEREDVLAELATLKTGEAFVWAPDFPEKHPIGLKRVTILERETFDSSATPKAGERPKEPKALAPVDLERLRSRMTATIERAKAEDPRELRRRITDLEATLAKANVAAERIDKKLDRVQIKTNRVEVPVLKDGQIKRIEVALNRVHRSREAITDHIQTLDRLKASLSEAASEIIRSMNAVKDTQAPLQVIGVASREILMQSSGMRKTASKQSNPPPSGEVSGLTPTQQRILDALAELEQLGAKAPERTLVALLAGYTNLASKGFVNAMSSLRTAGQIDYPSSRTVSLTSSGRTIASPSERPRSSEEIQDRIIRLLGGATGRILSAVIRAYPDSVLRVDVAKDAGYTNLASKGFVNGLSRLRSLGFVDYPSSKQVVAQPVLFLES